MCSGFCVNPVSSFFRGVLWWCFFSLRMESVYENHAIQCMKYNFFWLFSMDSTLYPAYLLSSLCHHSPNTSYVTNFGPNTSFNQSVIRSDEGLMLRTSAFQSLYGGQFTLSTPLMNQIFAYHCPTNTAPQFLQKLIPLN